jgi:membrane associated rhomboid family serine protease
MIPLYDVIPSRTIPVVTIGLIVVNVLVFLFELSLGNSLDLFLYSYGLIPAEFSIATLLTSMFLHGGFAHVAGNMLFLWIFGDNVEDRMGHGRFLLFYLLCGAAAALAQTLMLPESRLPMVGASGAVAGVMGAYFVLYPRSLIVTFVFFTFVEVPAILFLGLWFLVQFLNGVGSVAASATSATTGGIAFWAHVAGFAAGAAGVFAFRRPERQRVEWWDEVR